MDADFGDIGVAVADAVDVGDDDFVGVVEAGGELVEEFVGAAVLVGLENGEDFGLWAVFFAEGFEGCADFGGMVGVVVVKVGVAAEAFVFHAAPSALEGFERFFCGGVRDFEKIGGLAGGGGVFEIVLAGNLEFKVFDVLPASDVGFGFGDGFLAIVVVLIDYDVGGVGKGVSEGFEGLDVVGFVFVIVEVFGFDVGDEENLRFEVGERFLIFAGFDEEVFALAEAVILIIDLGDFCADDDGWVEAGFDEDEGEHGGCGGFAVSASDGDGEVVFAEATEGFGVGEAFDAFFACGDEFGVFWRDCWRINDERLIGDIRGIVADRDFCALGCEVFGKVGGFLVGAGDLVALV